MSTQTRIGQAVSQPQKQFRGSDHVRLCCFKPWSKTQHTVAQSSAEAELTATVKGATGAIGFVSLAADLGIESSIRMHIDASAALGIVERRGVGRVRHLDVGMLWLQEQQLKQIVATRKILGTDNPADMMTKALTRRSINNHSAELGFEFRDGRAHSTAQMHSFHTDRISSEEQRPAGGEHRMPPARSTEIKSAIEEKGEART